MAPTEILAEQHAESLASWLTAAGVRLALLTGRVARRRRDGACSRSSPPGAIDVLVGTHALAEAPGRVPRGSASSSSTSSTASASRTARASSARASRPHVLVMTATPIPRSLAWAIYGELDVSVLDEKPPGPRRDRDARAGRGGPGRASTAFAGERVAAGERVYVVVPAIEEGEREVAATRETAARIAAALPGGSRSASSTAGCRPRERTAVLPGLRGRAGVRSSSSTTVVEVGVDVPEATLMIVENAEVFGLAQLHQLRGRVGRSARRSWCALIAGRDATPRTPGASRGARDDVRRLRHRREGPRGARPGRPPRHPAVGAAGDARRRSGARPRGARARRAAASRRCASGRARRSRAICSDIRARPESRNRER